MIGCKGQKLPNGITCHKLPCNKLSAQVHEFKNASDKVMAIIQKETLSTLQTNNQIKMKIIWNVEWQMLGLPIPKFMKKSFHSC